jgi:hypothetical protein
VTVLRLDFVRTRTCRGESIGCHRSVGTPLQEVDDLWEDIQVSVFPGERAEMPVTGEDPQFVLARYEFVERLKTDDIGLRKDVILIAGQEQYESRDVSLCRTEIGSRC